MFPRSVELAFRRFQRRRDPRALAFVFDRTAKDLLALGRHLTSPGTDAEDLVQATFVTAIEDASSFRDGERLVPWLVGILVNHARAARRRSRRPLDATRLSQPIADAAADVVANDVTAELHSAIDRLPEVYRPVLRLVCEHGLAANEIARTLERPAGTVRAQVTRGLDLLRRTLPAGLASGAALTMATGSGLAAVRSEVLARCGGTATGFVSAVTLGGIVVLQHKILAALAAVVLAVLGWFLFEPDPATTTVAANETAPPVASTSAPIDAAHAPTGDSPALTRTATETATGTAAAPAEAPTPTVGELLVRVVDTNQAPCPGIGVDVLPTDSIPDPGRTYAHRPTDANGEVRFTNLAQRQWAVDLDRAGVVQLAMVTAGERAEVVATVPAGVLVRGTVRDGTGTPVPDASVALVGNRATNVVVATTDGAGAFTIEHLTPGLELQARARGRQPSLSVPIGSNRGSQQTIDLVIGDSARTISGRVLDPDGHAIAGAAVAVLPAAAGLAVAPPGTPSPRATWLRTVDDGSFRCDEAANGPTLVFADASARGHAPAWIEVDARSDTAFADLRLARGARLEGTVQRDGTPMPFAQVTLWPLEEPPIGYLLNLFGHRTATTGADGTFRITGLLALRQSARAMLGNGTLIAERELVLRDGETTTWNVEARRGQRLVIRVEGAESLGATLLVALVTNTTLRNGEVPHFVTIESRGLGSHTAPRTEPVDIVLTAMPGGASMLQLAAIRNVAPSERSVKFVLTPGDVPKHSIRGRLVDATAASLAHAIVAARKVSTDGLVVYVETATAADGTFDLGPLPAGDYTLLTGSLRDARPVGTAVLTPDRDENVGDLRRTMR